MTPSPLSREIYEALRAMPVIDTHEHLWPDEASIYKEEDDVLREYLLHYLKSDIVSAGLKQADLRRVLDHSLPIAQRWAIVAPYWERARYTGYGRALDIAAEAIYGIPQINGETIGALNEAFLAQRKVGHYAHVLRDMCNIRASLVDVWTFQFDGPHDLLRPVWQAQNLFTPSEPDGHTFLPDMEAKHGLRIASLDDWMGMMALELDGYLARSGLRVLKTNIAYSRTLRFEKVEYAVAKPLFDSALAAWRGREGEQAAPAFPIPLQDFLMHHLLSLANERNLTYQWHTGLLEGNGNTLANSDPSLLNNLFLAYPDVDFDLFHISYPYQGIACALSKMFPNVYIDMCWAHIISPAASMAALDDFLDAVPYSKISAFGGDYRFVDGVYGHLELSRRNVSAVLAGKVAAGVFSQEKAVEIGRALYYENPKRICKL